jgi:hypothetical protein
MSDFAPIQKYANVCFTLAFCSARALVSLANAASSEVDDCAMAKELSQSDHDRLNKRFEDIILELKTEDKWKDFKRTFGADAELSDHVVIPRWGK